ncbi:MAG: M20 family metallopeptidase [Firmicutes bacterium]|uniref:Amidohydrolase n=1 Tax=Sulfobacillus benefaciens TaxID=453960 RepID=A0A2T2X1D8_9FIRM|nr:M20 family metallopeptidase [Bacillota bacterium]PSR28313.1 MAG: amidohydrolase [Sulfobacillus benefaciens]
MDQTLWQEIQPWMVNIRRQIHQYPELGLDTPKTAALIEEALDKLGVRHNRVIETGVVAHLGPSEGEAGLLRADMDGLPVMEQTNLPFSSGVPNRMHACGHDAHTAMLLGAAYYLSRYESELTHPVTLMFQPGEEGPGGALPMIESGVLANPPVKCALMTHVDSDLPWGTIGVFSGAAMASPNDFTIQVYGRGGHGAHPNVTIDAIVAASAIVQGCQILVSREQDPTEPLVVTFGTIHGGYRENVIADYVELTGTIRILSPNKVEPILERFATLVDQMARSYRARAEVTINRGYPPLLADVQWTNQVETLLRRELGSEAVLRLSAPSMGAEDFAYIAQKVPATNLHVGVVGPDFVTGIHSSQFNLDERALLTGAKAYAAVALYL